MTRVAFCCCCESTRNWIIANLFKGREVIGDVLVLSHWRLLLLTISYVRRELPPEEAKNTTHGEYRLEADIDRDKLLEAGL